MNNPALRSVRPRWWCIYMFCGDGDDEDVPGAPLAGVTIWAVLLRLTAYFPGADFVALTAVPGRSPSSMLRFLLYGVRARGEGPRM